MYKEALVKNVYNGIDIRYYFDKGNLRYDYIVHPGADPRQIAFTLKGSDKTYLNREGNLVFTTRFGEVQMADLYCYQAGDKKVVQSRFTKRGDTWSVQVSNYDKTQDLVIDPLIYSTYIGGSDDDYGYGIAIDGSGNAYVTGQTASTDYDTTQGAFQTTHGGGDLDVFVTKLSLVPTSVSEALPYRYILHQNYPNPFNPETFIEFELAKPGRVKLAVYDVLGREVKVLIDGEDFDAGGLSSGVYYYRLTAGGGEFVDVKKMVLVK